jgi:hypothetical protein
MIDQIAKWIHERWLEGDWPKQDHLNRPYDELAEIDKEDNRAAARRIPDGLALVGLGLVRRGEAEAGKGLDESALKAYLEAHIERLAEAEHDGWMRHRAKNGWTFGKPRDDAKKLHPSMIAYKDLPASEKEKDRIAIRNYPNQVKGAGYEIVWL